MISMNGAGKIASVERVHRLEDQAVLALTQLMTLYLDKSSSNDRPAGQGMAFKAAPNGREIRIKPRSIDIAAITRSVLEHPAPVVLRNGMRAIGTAIYEETNSTEAMSDVMYRVMENFPNRDQEVVRILDHAFDGIGGWWP